MRSPLPKSAVRVVVEGAPADAAGILRIGSKLVVNARVTQRVLGQSLDVVDGFGGVSVAYEFGVEIARMIRLLQREAEIVHGENIFQKFGGHGIADAAGLSRGIEAMSHRVRARIEIVVVFRLVDAHAPQNTRRPGRPERRSAVASGWRRSAPSRSWPPPGRARSRSP